MVWMSTIDIRTGNPSSAVSVDTERFPSTIKLTSNDVPPMSTQSRFGRSSASLNARPPMVPPTGPERSVWIGIRCAAVEVITPPFDCMTWRRTGTPRSAICASRLFK